MSEFAGEVYGIEKFVPAGSNADLLRQIELSLTRVNQARDAGPTGLPPDVIRKIEEEFLVDRVRHSATIEGSNLDRRETVHVLTTGQIIEGKRRSSRETQNLGRALRLVADQTDLAAIDLDALLGVHAQLMEGLDDYAGRLRMKSIMLTGAKYQPPGPEKVPGMIGTLLESLQTADQQHGGFTTGVYAHWVLARIHPFADGNGRMARILQDWIFLRNRLVPAPISYTQADEYYAALQEADAGRPESFIKFVALAALKSLARYQSALDTGREAEVWIDDLATVAGEKTRDQESALYLNWSQRLAELRETFESVAEKLQLRLPLLQIRFTKYGGLDLQGFRRVKNQGTAPPIWDFGLEIRDATQTIKYVFGYVRHTQRDGDTLSLDDVPVLTMSELPYIQGEQLSLREISMQAGEFVRVRQDSIQPLPQIDVPITPHTICRDFFQDVLRIRFGIG